MLDACSSAHARPFAANRSCKWRTSRTSLTPAEYAIRRIRCCDHSPLFAQALGVADRDLFVTVDLYEKKNVSVVRGLQAHACLPIETRNDRCLDAAVQVTRTVMQLAEVSRRVPTFNGPFMGKGGPVVGASHAACCARRCSFLKWSCRCRQGPGALVGDRCCQRGACMRPLSACADLLRGPLVRRRAPRPLRRS